MLHKNPYLFKAKNINTAADLITELLYAYLSSSEEKIFGDFLEELALYIAGRIYRGKKSAAPGIDLEFRKQDIDYLISIKSGTNWGNSSQQSKQENDFKNAVKVLKQSNQTMNIQPVLGICYGKTRTSFIRGYMKVVGQSFWYLISDSKFLYKDIIEPIGYKAREHNDDFLKEKARIVNLFTNEFINDFCRKGIIDWNKLVVFDSKNII